MSSWSCCKVLLKTGTKASPDLIRTRDCSAGGLPWRARSNERLKHPPLLTPIDMPDDRAQVSLVQSRSLCQKQELLLNVRGEMEQLHDLRHAPTRDRPQAGQLGVISQPLLPHPSLKANGQRHQPRDPRNRSKSPVFAGCAAFAAASSPGQVKCVDHFFPAGSFAAHSDASAVVVGMRSGFI